MYLIMSKLCPPAHLFVAYTVVSFYFYAALNLVLKPIGGKITEMEGEIWMVTLNNKMRQFSEGISLPPAANSRSRAKVVFRSILDPLAAAAQAAAQQAATMAARGGKSGSGGKSGPSDEQRRLMAQGRYAPY